MHNDAYDYSKCFFSIHLRYYLQKKRTHQHVDRLDDIEKNLVLAILDAFRPPTHCIRDCHRRARGRLQFVTFLCDEPGV